MNKLINFNRISFIDNKDIKKSIQMKYKTGLKSLASDL